MQRKKTTFTVLLGKTSKDEVDDVALGVGKTGDEEGGVRELGNIVSQNKFE